MDRGWNRPWGRSTTDAARTRSWQRLGIAGACGILGIALLTSCSSEFTAPNLPPAPTAPANGPVAEPQASATAAMVNPGPVTSPTGQQALDPESDATATVVPGPVATPSVPPSDVGVPPTNAAALLVWVPPGPADPADPEPNNWYAQLVPKKCGQMPAGSALAAAAHSLCVAVTTNDQKAWAQTDAVYRALPQPAPSGCLESATYRVLANLLKYHAANPDTAVKTVPGAKTACPLRLSGITDPSGDATLTNPHVPAAGGTTLRLKGRFQDVSAVLVDGHSVPVDKLAQNHFVFTAPPALHSGSVTVRALGADGQPMAGTARFTYDPASSTPTPIQPPSSPDAAEPPSSLPPTQQPTATPPATSQPGTPPATSPKTPPATSPPTTAPTTPPATAPSSRPSSDSVPALPDPPSTTPSQGSGDTGSLTQVVPGPVDTSSPTDPAPSDTTPATPTGTPSATGPIQVS